MLDLLEGGRRRRWPLPVRLAVIALAAIVAAAVLIAVALCIVLAVAWVMDESAEASTPRPRAERLANRQAEIPKFEQIAIGYWGQSVDCHLSGGVRYHWHPAPGHRDAEATADLGGCDMWINPHYWLRTSASYRYRFRCDSFVHEYGHLLGYGHTTDGSVMDPLRFRIVAPCRARPA